MSYNFPAFPPLPPYDPSDPANGIDYNNPYGINGYMQVLMDEITAVATHPSNPAAYLQLIRTFADLSHRGLLTDSDIHFLNDSCNLQNIFKDGLDYAAQFSFIYGYGGNGPDANGQYVGPAGKAAAMAAYTAFAQLILNLHLPQNVLGKALTDEANTIINGASDFVDSHIASAAGTDVYGNPVQQYDIIWKFNQTYTNADGTLNSVLVTYDWTQANQQFNKGLDNDWVTGTLQTITDLISDASVAGSPNPDVSTLQQALIGMQIQESLNTFNQILKQTGNVGLALLAFIYTWEGYKMNSELSGPADVMDKEKEFSQIAKRIEDNLKEIASGSYSGQSASQLVGDTVSLFIRINGSSQFKDGLSPAVASAINQFESTKITFPEGSTTQVSLWELFMRTAEPASSADYVKPEDLKNALIAALAPVAPSGSGGTPPVNPDPGTVALQGILGGYDGLVTAVSSNSTQEVTTSQQGEALIQALDKLMTGVTDKTMGMNTAVIQKTLQIAG